MSADPSSEPKPPEELRPAFGLLESNPDYAYVFDRQRRIVYANAATLELWGLSLSDAIGKTLPEIGYPPELVAQMAPLMDQVFETGAPVKGIDLFYTNPAGKEAWYEIAWWPVLGSSDEVELVAGISRDATDRKQAEIRLRDSERRLRQAIEIKTVGVLFWSPEFRLNAANDAFLKLSGFTLDEAIGLTWQQLTPQEFHAASERAAAEVRSLGQCTPYEKQYFRKDGSRWWGLFAARQISEQEVVEFVLDVSDRRAKEQALAASEERLRLILENATDYAIFTLDSEGRIDQWYAGAQAVFGWSAEEAAGQPVEITFTADDLAAGQPAKERETAAREGRAPNVRWHVRKDGSLVFIDGISTALRGPDGTLQGFLKIGQDVTERNRAEEHQRTLLAELQHRVRNTLAIVRSIARRTAETSTDVEEMASHFQGRLDAFSRVQAIVTRDPEGGIDLAGLVEDELLAHAAREGEALRIEGPDVSLRPRPAESISLAIHELATNAVKYGALSADRGRIAVTWDRVQQDGEEQLRLVWEENGVDLDGGTPTREGFGLELLQRSLPYDLRAKTDMEFRREGIRFTMAMPLGPEVVADGDQSG